MITTLRQPIALSIVEPQARRTYSMHKCGLCHALGDHYGPLFRLVASHEPNLLSLLTSAQHADEPGVVKRRCPLNPLFKVSAHQDLASEFAAAVAIELANAKFADDVQDSGGRDGAAHIGQWLARKPHQVALRTLKDFGVDVEILGRLGERQTRAEEDETQDPAGPSAAAGAALFAATARLAATPENVEALTTIGANFGAYVYLLDAYRDFARDMPRGEYNPLRRFGEQSSQALTLTQPGLEWLLGRFEMIQTAVRENVPKLHLYRYADLLATLLCGPIDEIVLELSHRVRQPELTFRRWQWVDVLKAGLFMLPVSAFGESSSSDCWLDRAMEDDGECKKPREILCGNNCLDFTLGCCQCHPTGG